VRRVGTNMVVKVEVKSNHCEQAFWTDTVGIIKIYIQSMMMGWYG
jgi:hypothetical protein